MAWHGMAWYGVASIGVAWRRGSVDTARHGMARHAAHARGAGRGEQEALQAPSGGTMSQFDAPQIAASPKHSPLLSWATLLVALFEVAGGPSAAQY